MTMTKGIIYYTDNRLSEPIFSLVQKQISKANLPIVSVSQKPINFGKNFIISEKPGIITMIKQIALALEKSEVEFVFFCEHDVLYPQSHFDFTPTKEDIFFYNENVWRWDYPRNFAITYDRLISLSGLSVKRKFALEHYQKRLKKILESGFHNESGHEPDWARKWGYEPGTKKMKRGGFSDDDFKTFKSEFPLVDIRHGQTFSPRKVSLDRFKHPPTGWKETTLEKIPGWNLNELFNLNHG